MAAKTFTVVVTERQTQIVLPMPLPYVPVPPWLAATDAFAIILVPLWILGITIVRFVRHREPPPRASFTITPDRFEMILVAPDTSERTVLDCDPQNIVELRKNRYENGLWIRVRGQLMETFLHDIDDETVQALAKALAETLDAMRSPTDRDRVSATQDSGTSDQPITNG